MMPEPTRTSPSHKAGGVGSPKKTALKITPTRGTRKVKLATWLTG